jgi:transposase
MRKALNSVDNHLGRILQRWTSSHSNARLEGLNGLFQAAGARARGYRNTTTFATMLVSSNETSSPAKYSMAILHP